MLFKVQGLLYNFSSNEEAAIASLSDSSQYEHAALEYKNKGSDTIQGIDTKSSMESNFLSRRASFQNTQTNLFIIFFIVYFLFFLIFKEEPIQPPR